MGTDFIDTELATLNLGDRRRTRRAKQLLKKLARSPASSFPEVFSDDAELEACYRLQNNEDVGYHEFLCAHRDASWARASGRKGSVLVLHDTSEVVYESDGEREGLTQKKGTQSYHAHVALAVAEEELPVVHGVVGLLPTIIRDKTWFEVTPEDEENELWVGSQRWWLLAEEVRQTAPPEATLIHVMDREADDYTLLTILQEQGDDFVIRSKHDRKLEKKGEILWDTLSAVPILAKREVLVSKRGGKRLPGTKKTHPDRRRRKATLTIRACAVVLARPDGVEPVGKPVMRLWIVEAVEEHPPAGEPTVRWRLLTTLPTENAGDALRVVDIYRKRWLIEEFFKSLKTGCSLTKRQARSRGTLLTILGMMLPLAWRLLALRTMEREAPKTPASDLLDAIELKALRKLAPKARLPKNPNLAQALSAM